MASKLVSYVHTVQLKLKIEQATLPHHDDPTPPNVMDALIATIGRDRKNIDDAVDCLEQRLLLRSTSTKQKALKLIKYMSQRGPWELQRALVRLSGQVKELQTYRCAPDTFKGDIPWKRVQEYAREALEAMHAVKGEDGMRNALGNSNGGEWSSRSVSSVSSSVGRQMEGFGSDGGGSNRLAGAKSTSAGTQRYEGFGSGGARDALNTNVLEPQSDSMRELPFATKLAMGFSELKSAALAGASGLGDFAGAHIPSVMGGPETASDGYQSTYSPPARPQIDVDAFGEHGYSPTSVRKAEAPMSSSSNAAGARQGPSAGRSGPGKSSQTPEEKLVNNFVSKTSHGVRVAPTSDECNKFLITCGSHGSLPLVNAFENTLEHGSWKEVLRALCVLDVAATGGGVSGVPAVASLVAYFKEHPASLQRATESAQERVKSKAMSVMERLGVDCPGVRPIGGVSGGGQPLRNSGNTADLLSMDSTPQESSGVNHTDAKSLPSLLEALDVNLTDSDCVELTPNSPIAGLISADGPSVKSKLSDPFGDWLGADETSPVPTSPGTLSSGLPERTHSAPTDPFATMDMLSGGSSSPTAPMMPITRSNGTTSAPPTTNPPIMDDLFTSTGPTLPAVAPPSTNNGPQGAATDVLGAWHATTSGFSSSQREEAAFDFGDLKDL